MIDVLVYSLVNEMEKEKIIESKMKEHYIYALTIISERFIAIALIFIISVLANKKFELMIFLLFFLALRNHTGGFHAKSYGQCLLGTVIISIMVICIVPIAATNMWIIYFLLVNSIVFISLIGTVNHPNLNMSYLELCESKKSARTLLWLESVVIVWLIILDIPNVYICYMSASIILCAFLLVLAKILKQEVKCYEEK